MSDLTGMKEHSPMERLLNGLLKENPTFVLMLGMCPTLAVTTSAINGLGMGLATTAVLMMSNLIISLLRKVIPSRVRIPAFIVIIATFVTVVQLLMEAYLPSLNEALGMYISLIVVNCIILGRAESYAYSHPPLSSFFDGLGMGFGFSLALTCIGAVREILGAGSLFQVQIMPASYTPINIFVLAPGAFFVLAALTAVQNYLKLRSAKAGKEKDKIRPGCDGDCVGCGDTGCTGRFYDTAQKPMPAEKAAGGKSFREQIAAVLQKLGKSGAPARAQGKPAGAPAKTERKGASGEIVKAERKDPAASAKTERKGASGEPAKAEKKEPSAASVKTDGKTSADISGKADRSEPAAASAKAEKREAAAEPAKSEGQKSDGAPAKKQTAGGSQKQSSGKKNGASSGGGKKKKKGGRK